MKKVFYTLIVLLTFSFAQSQSDVTPDVLNDSTVASTYHNTKSKFLFYGFKGNENRRDFIRRVNRDLELRSRRYGQFAVQFEHVSREDGFPSRGMLVLVNRKIFAVKKVQLKD
ncbi:hypothetical protein [uncultured Croceitalea sp.]|uniref:hypothetical protein n=1 Tax=uncultured Croceitalea sp. TaxID=1798908 RepID=UPI00330661D9